VADQATRGAARTAALIAVPTALVAGLLAYWGLNRSSATPGPTLPSVQATGPVAMAAPPLSDDTAVACRALLSQLPDALRDRPRRPVTAGAEQNAAFGDPAITLACGAGPRPSIAPTADLLVLNNVCWYETDDKDGTTWYPVDRVVPIAVHLPAAYQPAAQWAIEFSNPVAGSIRSITDVPTGCKDG
jgi:Protein of unknown function (DUF3515)